MLTSNVRQDITHQLTLHILLFSDPEWGSAADLVLRWILHTFDWPEITLPHAEDAFIRHLLAVSCSYMVTRCEWPSRMDSGHGMHQTVPVRVRSVTPIFIITSNSNTKKGGIK